MKKIAPAWGVLATLTLALGSEARAAILTVDSDLDTTVVNGDCTLREAILEANRVAGMVVYSECGNPTIGAGDSIFFDAGLAGQTILVGSTLQVQSDTGTSIDAQEQGIVLDGTGLAGPVLRVTAVGFAIHGMTIVGGTYGIETLGNATNAFIGGASFADGNIIKEATIGGISVSSASSDIQFNTFLSNDGPGIWVAGAIGLLIHRNRIGIDGASTIFPNDEGVFINTGDVTMTTNVISGNLGAGVRIADATVTLTGNRIGLDFAGTVDKGNGSWGVDVNNNSDVTIGGPTQAERNWISGNGFAGVYVHGANSVVDLQLNRIGTNLAGTAAIPNSLDGVLLTSFAEATLTQNLISGNSRWGVQLDAGEATLTGNRIGVTPAMAALPNASGGITTNGAMLLERNVIAFHSGVGDPGIKVESSGDLLAGTGENCITDNTYGLFDDTSLDISIDNSWWGDASGPSDVGGGLGDPLTENNTFGATDYAPVQAAPTIACP